MCVGGGGGEQGVTCNSSVNVMGILSVIID